MSYRYPDDQLRRILAGCRTGEEWWGWHPTLPVEVSNMGNVRGAVGKVGLHKGYPAVTIQGRRHKIHHLVLQTFISDMPDGLECCHFDDVKTNNRLDNLRWDDALGNAADRRRINAAKRPPPPPRPPRPLVPHAAQRRHEVARRLAILDKLQELSTG